MTLNWHSTVTILNNTLGVSIIPNNWHQVNCIIVNCLLTIKNHLDVASGFTEAILLVRIYIKSMNEGHEGGKFM